MQISQVRLGLAPSLQLTSRGTALKTIDAQFASKTVGGLLGRIFG